MVELGQHTYAEIMSQPNVWEDAVNSYRQNIEAVQALWTENTFDRVLFTGCGSTHYLSKMAAVLFQQQVKVLAQAYPASEIILIPELVFAPQSNTLLIAISRSGETTETLKAVEIYQEKTKNPVLAITCYEESQLAQMADVVISIPSAKEESVAQTRSFSSMAIVIEAIVGLLAHLEQDPALNSLPKVADSLLSRYASLAQELAEDEEIERFFFLGTGSLYGIAAEAMIKMTEMSLSYSEAYHTLEFRHGPMSMVNEKTLVIGLISEDMQQQEIAVLKQMKEQGAQVLILAEDEHDPSFSEWAHFVHLQSGLPHWLRPIIYLPILQLLSYYRAMKNDLNPDQPKNLVSFISLDGF